MTKRILALFVFLCCQVAAMAQLAPERKDIYRGNARFSEENLDGAIGEYRKALQKDSTSYSANYNLGNTVYKSAANETNAEVRAGKFEEASRFLDKAMETDPTFESWFNKGNVLMQQENYQQAVDAYKEALLLNPGDMDAKRNYIYARQKAQQQQDQQQNQQNQNNDQNQDQNQNQNNDQQQNQDQNKDQDQNNDQNQDNQQGNNQDQRNNQDQQNNQDQNKDQNKDQNDNNRDQDNKNNDKDKDQNNDQNQDRNNNNQNNQDQPQQGDSQPQQGKMDQRQAEQLLQAIADKEKKTQEKVREAEAAKAVGARSDKNW